MRFCDAQITVKRARIVIDQALNRLEQSGSAAWFEEVGDDLADLAGRGLEFLDVVPSWDGAFAHGRRAVGAGGRIAADKGWLHPHRLIVGTRAPGADASPAKALRSVRRDPTASTVTVDRQASGGMTPLRNVKQPQNRRSPVWMTAYEVRAKS